MYSIVINQVVGIISCSADFVDSFCMQDDCLAINRGRNIVFRDNYCNGGHGISIVRGLNRPFQCREPHDFKLQGSITSNVVVEGVVVEGNAVTNRCFIADTERYKLLTLNERFLANKRSASRPTKLRRTVASPT